MELIRGCQDGKYTPKLTEVVCPRCGGVVEVFVKMNGGAGETGCIVSDENCPECGYTIAEGTPADSLEKA